MLITFEGIDTCGKGTQINLLKQCLEANKIEHIVVREPGTTDVGKDIRKILLTKDMEPETELLLFFAARKEVVEKIIKPALDQDKIVICDRFYHSTLAYQGYG